MTRLTWIESNGGPLIVVPRALLAAWRGTDNPPPGHVVQATFRWNPGGPATDYDRACDVSDYAGVIPVGSGEALVLGDEPLQTTWLPGRRGGVFVRWRFAPGEASVAAILERGPPDDLEWASIADWRVDGPQLEAFDAAEPGLEPLGERIAVELPPGRYAVDHGEYAPNPDVALSMIRVRRRDRPAVSVPEATSVDRP